MKRSRIIAAAMASIVMTGALGSCGFVPGENSEPDVYGPPSAYEDDEDVRDESSSVSTGEFDPELNVEPDVYGPPSAFE